MEFDKLNLNELDKNLSEEQKKEWNAIYASYRAGSMLGGKVIGVDSQELTIYDPATGKSEHFNGQCLVVIAYRVKILIPSTKVWFNEEQNRPEHVLRSMIGATVDFVITTIDREKEFCIASRRRALKIRRRIFLRLNPKIGKKEFCDIIAVGRGRMLCSCNGFDVTLIPRDVSYAMVPDLRERFHPGEEKEAIIKGFDMEQMKLILSIKEAQPHPFDGAEDRHPIHCRRASIITGKYRGGVFCRLEDDLDCLCTYSQAQYDDEFHIGDQVIIAITKYDFERRLVYGRIMVKW